MKTKIVIALAIVFVSGVIIGFFSGHVLARYHTRHMISKGPEHLECLLVSKLSKKLDLSESQLPAVREHVHTVISELEKDRSERHKMLKDKIVHLLQDIRPILTKTQQNKLDSVDIEFLMPQSFRSAGHENPQRDCQATD